MDLTDRLNGLVPRIQYNPSGEMGRKKRLDLGTTFVRMRHTNTLAGLGRMSYTAERWQGSCVSDWLLVLEGSMRFLERSSLLWGIRCG